MTLRLEDAIVFAARAHRGQRYGDGPYILHPLRVMMMVYQPARIAAVLHDCDEDTGTLPEGLDDVDAHAIELLTKPPNMRYSDYIDRMAQARGPAADRAREVKLADLQDNMGHMTVDKQHLLARYRRARDVLVNVITDPQCKFCGSFYTGGADICPDCLDRCMCRVHFGLMSVLACPVHGMPPYRFDYFKGVH